VALAVPLTSGPASMLITPPFPALLNLRAATVRTDVGSSVMFSFAIRLISPPVSPEALIVPETVMEPPTPPNPSVESVNFRANVEPETTTSPERMRRFLSSSEPSPIKRRCQAAEGSQISDVKKESAEGAAGRSASKQGSKRTEGAGGFDRQRSRISAGRRSSNGYAASGQ